MSEEYYEKNLFGEVVSTSVTPEESDSGEIDFNKSRSDFNIFALTDAIGARDKRSAWVIYQRALASGMTAEEIFWRVMWGTKALLLAERCASAEEASLNPFVYKKSKSFLKNWKLEELEKLSEALTSGYHEARRGIFNLDSLLERIILSI